MHQSIYASSYCLTESVLNFAKREEKRATRKLKIPTNDKRRTTRNMCIKYLEWIHCYECHAEFSYRLTTIPCLDVELGRPCPKSIGQPPVVLDYETCLNCKERRRAEEICSQHVHRQKPLYYNIERGGCIRETFW